MINPKGNSASRIIPFAIYILFLAIDHPLARMIEANGFDSRWLYVARVGLVGAFLLWMWRGYSELKWPINISVRGLLIAIVTGMAVFALWVMPYPDWAAMEAAWKGFDPTASDGRIVPMLALCRLAGGALVVPLMEELFWRSFFMRWIENPDFSLVNPSQIRWFAFVVTAALFAVEHNLWLAGLLAGLAFGGLYVKFGNLWVPVIAHAVTNAMLGIWVLYTGAWHYW